MNRRILLISSNSSGRGGGEKYLVYLAQALSELFYDVHVLLSDAHYMDVWAVELESVGAIVYRQKLLGLRSRPLRIIQSITDRHQHQKIALTCKAIAPAGIIVNQQYDEDGLDYLTGALMADVAPVGGIMHMPMTANKNKRPLGKLRGRILKKWYTHHPYHLILVSRGCKEEFQQYYNVNLPIYVVPNGCTFPSPKNSIRKLPDSSRPFIPTIGYVGQFSSQKNLKLLVKSWLWMNKQGVESNLLLVGDGPERANIQEILEASEYSNRWKITGWQNSPENYFRVIDIFAMTSDFEGLPLALIEAAGRKIPAVVTNFNGASDVATRAKWVKIVDQRYPSSIGTALTDAIQNLQQLQHYANEGVEMFQDYFSFKRMGIDILKTLGIN
jgi:glycosyltransferase involved in cell wall biosynthesis